MQQVHFEVAAVTFTAQDVAQLSHHLPRGVRLAGWQHFAPNVVAAPGASVRSQLRITDQACHRGPDHGAVARHRALEADLDVADALHDFEFLLRGQVTGVLVPIALAAHEECPAAGGAVGDRDDEVVAQSGVLRKRQQFLVGAGATHHVRHARDACLVGQTRHDGLGTQPVAQLHRRMHDLQTRLPREGLSLLVHHHEAGLTAGSATRDELERLGIAQQVVADIAHGVEIDAVAPPGHEYARVYALERVKVGEVEEVSYPAVDAEQVERGGEMKYSGTELV